MKPLNFVFPLVAASVLSACQQPNKADSNPTQLSLNSVFTENLSANCRLVDFTHSYDEEGQDVYTAAFFKSDTTVSKFGQMAHQNLYAIRFLNIENKNTLDPSDIDGIVTADNEYIIPTPDTKPEDIQSISGLEGIHTDMIVSELASLPIVQKLRKQGILLVDQSDESPYTPDVQKIENFNKAVFNGKDIVKPSSFSYLSPGEKSDTIMLNIDPHSKRLKETKQKQNLPFMI